MNQEWIWGQDVGLTDGTRPNAPASREEAVTMIYRLSGILINGEDAYFLFTAEELDILYRIVWAEARGEDDKGMILVVNVIINRVSSPQFPNTIRDVVFQPNQFTPVTNGTFERAVICDRIKTAVHRALRGEDYSRGALFFRAVRGAKGSWHETALCRIFTHGGHHFYVTRG